MEAAAGRRRALCGRGGRDRQRCLGESAEQNANSHSLPWSLSAHFTLHSLTEIRALFGRSFRPAQDRRWRVNFFRVDTSSAPTQQEQQGQEEELSVWSLGTAGAAVGADRSPATFGHMHLLERGSTKGLRER
jgi:hypothetical protein